MSYTRTFSIKLLPSDTGLSLTARILTSARAAVTTDASAIELSGGEYSWTYTFTDNFIGYVDFYSAANTVFQTSTAIFPPDANVTSVNENSTAADNIQAIYDGVTGAPAKFTTLTTTGTTLLNALTVTNNALVSGNLTVSGVVSGLATPTNVSDLSTHIDTLIGTPIALDGGSATVSSMLTKMADDNNGLDFNSTTDSLNKIQTFVSSAVPTGYPPTSATRIHGTNSGGTFSDLAAHDEVYMVTTEDIADGLEIEIVRNASPIALTPSVLRIIGYYSGDPGHSMFVNIYNYLTSSYNTIGQMLVRVDAFDYSFPLTSDNQNVLTGEMKIQLVHDGTPFDAGDILYLDQVIFEKLSDPSSMDSVLASIKSKTDQLNFILGDVIATLDGEVVASNLVSIDGQLTSLNNAILNLKQLNIKSDGNLSAIDITGSGSGDAMKLVGGATGTSINAGGDIDTSTINQIQNGLSLTSDVTTAVTNINAHTDINLDAKVSTRAIPSDVTTAVTNINAHTDINLDAKVSTRAIPSDITTAVTNINAHTDSAVASVIDYDIDSTGGEVVPLSKAIEVILGVVGGKCEFNSTTAVWTVYGRDGTTIIFQGTTHGQGHRTSSDIL